MTVDNTLALVTNSAQSRGLPFGVVRNLPKLERDAKLLATPLRQRWKWNSFGALDDRMYKVFPVYSGTKEAKKLDAERARLAVIRTAFNPVGEVIKLAEGRDNLTLGRIFRRRYVP